MAEGTNQRLKWQLGDDDEAHVNEINVAHLPDHPLSSVGYDGNKVVISEQPFERTGSYRPMPVYTLDWASRNDSHFMPATALDFLLGVPEVLLLPTSDNLSIPEEIFLVKIPKRETLYMGMENSTSVQRALFCSQRSFNMSFLDPTKQEAAWLVRKGALTNFSGLFRQELVVSLPGETSPLGRIIQNKTISSVSFSIFEGNRETFSVIGSEKTYSWNLKSDVHFSILDPVHRTGGVILHKWDEEYKDFLYHITFPSPDTTVQHKMLLIGAALLVEFTYFKKSGWFCFSK